MSLADNIASYLEQNQPRIKLAILFGSVSRGEQRFESDMDIAVAGDNVLSITEKQELIELIGNYRRGYLPLIVPVTLLNHFVRKYRQPYLSDQTYLNPHPLDLQLRNHA